MERLNNETSNVQQLGELTGPVNSQAMKTVGTIVGEAANQPTEAQRKQAEEEQKRERLRQMLRETRIQCDTEVPPQEYTLEIDGTGFFARRDIHAVKAKAKAGKTTTLKVFIAALLLGLMFRVKSLLEKPRILYFDTEQSRRDTKGILDDVALMTGLSPEVIDGQVVLHSLRRVDREDLLALLRVAIDDERPDVVFIDGIVEFIASFNDEIESKQLIKDLLVLCEEYNCAIINVLHTNKADEDHNMRGHLGTMLGQKSGTVLECKKEKGSKVITVFCSESRHAEPTEWSIMFTEDGHIVDADEQRRQLLEERKAAQQQRRQEESERKQKERLDYALMAIRDHGGLISRKQLTEILTKKFELKRNTISEHISLWLKNGALFEVNGMIHASDKMALAF